jgi:carboxymethylenebutenolidase
MCFDQDSRPPIPAIAGGASDGSRIELVGAEGNRSAGFRARPTSAGGDGVVILPDVRGLHPYYEELALRFAEHGFDALAIDWFGRTAGTGRRGETFDHMAHVATTSWAGIAADIGSGVAALRDDGVARISTIGFCMGGRMSFLAGTLQLGLAGVIGLYGTLTGLWRNDAPEPLALAQAGLLRTPVLGLFGGADQAITADAVAAFDAALVAAGVEHRFVTYPRAPHSFFDRKAADFAAESAAAWDEILTFLRSRATAG